MYSFLTYIKNNFYNFENQFGFQDPSTALMENIIDLHHFIFFFVIIISGLVSWLLVQIIDNFIFVHSIVLNSQNKKNIKSLDKILIYVNALSASKNRLFKEDKYLEACWTIFPAIILIIISIPSFYMLYLAEESIGTVLTVKAIGYQWYWTYDYTDLFPHCYNLNSALDIDDYVIESYMEPAEYLNFNNGDFRLLETDDILMLPTRMHIRLIITSMDTLHSFALPSLGVKVDAVPGRLNTIDVFIYRMGIFYGQCSEICGVGHGFMPICLHAISFLNFLIGDL